MSTQLSTPIERDPKIIIQELRDQLDMLNKKNSTQLYDSIKLLEKLYDNDSINFCSYLGYKFSEIYQKLSCVLEHNRKSVFESIVLVDYLRDILNKLPEE